MCDGVVVAKVHGLGFRTPEIYLQLGFIASSLVNLYRRGIRLPEILQTDTDAPTDITYKGIARRAGASKCTNPWTFGGGSFANGIAVVCQLRQTILIPLGPMVKQFTVTVIKGLIFGNSLSLHLFSLKIPLTVAIDKDRSASVEWLHGFCPDTIIGCKGDMAVISLLTHRYL